MIFKSLHMRRDVAGIVSVLLIALFTTNIAHAEVIDTYFGMNFVYSTGDVPEVQLQQITYIGDKGDTYTVTIPAPDNSSFSGLPDKIGLSATPTYTSTNGDGETTRTYNKTVPIEWDTSGPAPIIQITDIEVNAPSVGGVWTARFDEPYTVGLIPNTGLDTELNSTFAAPSGDIYDEFIGASGNDVGTVIAKTTPVGYESFQDTAFGQFIFSAAWAADTVEKLGELITDVANVNAKQGIQSSLDVKLEAAIDTVEDVKKGNKSDVGRKLDAFISEVEAQSEKKIPKGDAAKLVKKAVIIKCGGGYGYGYGYGYGDGYGDGYGSGPYSCSY